MGNRIRRILTSLYSDQSERRKVGKKSLDPIYRQPDGIRDSSNLRRTSSFEGLQYLRVDVYPRPFRHAQPTQRGGLGKSSVFTVGFANSTSGSASILSLYLTSPLIRQ